MERGDKIDWLKRYWTAEQEILRLREGLKQARSQAEFVGKVFSFAPAGQREAASKAERFVEKQEEIQEAILEEMEKQADAKKEIETAVLGIVNCQYRILIKLVYLSGCTLKQAAKKMNYSYIWARKNHGKAVDSLEITKDIQ